MPGEEVEGLRIALAYAKERRRTFGKPIIEHRAVAFRLADMAIRGGYGYLNDFERIGFEGVT